MKPIRIVLLRPRNADNLGAIARAMSNFGMTDWAVVQPNPLLLESAAARQMAVRAEDRLQMVRVCGSLEEAISDCVWVVGTSMRSVRGLPKLAPRDVAREAAHRAGTVALVFGDERSGLRNEEMLRCHALSGIPTEEEQPSLNLAQAVLVYCYEFRLSQLEAAPAQSKPSARLATDEELFQLDEQLGAALVEGGFLDPQQPRHAVRDLSRPWRRARLTAAESQLWNAALRQLRKRRQG